MKIVIVSDTHEMHDKISVPDGDVLVHAGDFTFTGTPIAVERFNTWLGTLPHKHKIVIPGNHDLTFDPEMPGGEKSAEYMRSLIKNATLLIDQEVVIDGIKFWGSPVTPSFGIGWGFNKMRGAEIKETWDKIPMDTDVLITHGPPKGVLDYAFKGWTGVGCEELAYAVARVKPQLHVFGHIHGGYGEEVDRGIEFRNASIVNEGYRVQNDPWVYEVTFAKIKEAEAKAEEEVASGG